MPNSNRWSISSAPCRLEWRASRWVISVLLMLGMLGAVSVLASEMSRVFAWPLALLATGYGVFLARSEAHRPSRQLVWPQDGPITLDGDVLTNADLQWRGPLAFLCWRGAAGRIHRLSWWPDTLPAEARRELRLAAMQRPPARPARSMAP